MKKIDLITTATKTFFTFLNRFVIISVLMANNIPLGSVPFLWN